MFRHFGSVGRQARSLSTLMSSTSGSSKRAGYLAAAPAALVAAAVGGYCLTQQEPAKGEFFDFNESRLRDLDERLRSLEMSAGAEKNMAFVFVKPHAAGSPKVIELLKERLAATGIAVTAEGVMDAKTIDEMKYIDTHYGAIASKAVSLKPSELNVPAKGQAGFQEMFGISWSDALSKGLVYNAADACQKLGLSGAQLDEKWSQLKRGKDMIKFGGGFYCGKVDDIYVMNGFYMSMRAMYTTPPAQIYYMTVEWPSASLSWEDFRGKVLGATNPMEAAVGSVRRLIMETWEFLGLSALPDTGNNGVHASASPFEGLAERMNWLSVDPSKDTFGRALLAAGISVETIYSWAADPQVNYPEGGKGSLFDALEDLNADEVIQKAKSINAANAE